MIEGMSGLEEEAPRLAEIARTIKDFRQEFREAMQGVVRRDVYEANMQTTKLHIDNAVARIQSLEMELDETRRTKDNDRKSLRNLALSALFPAGLSLLLTVLGLVK